MMDDDNKPDTPPVAAERQPTRKSYPMVMDGGERFLDLINQGLDELLRKADADKAKRGDG